MDRSVRPVTLRLPWFTLYGHPQSPGTLARLRCVAAMLVHEVVELAAGSAVAHSMGSAQRYAIGVPPTDRFLFPDEGQRIIYTPGVRRGSALTSAAGLEVFIWDEEIGGSLAEIIFLDESPVEQPLVVDEDSRLPQFYGPDGISVLWAQYAGDDERWALSAQAEDRIAKFPPGPVGPSGTIAIGDVTTVAPEEPATVVNSGTPEAAVLDFEIPKGEQGDSGVVSATGLASYTPETQTIHVRNPTPAEAGADPAGTAAFYVTLEVQARQDEDAALQAEVDALQAEVDALPESFYPRPAALDALPAQAIIAHRGGGGPAPENTLEAMRVAAATGAHALEMDVQPLGDGAAGVMHDTTVDRTTDGTGSVSNFSALTWQQLNAADGFPWPSVARPPLLTQVVSEFGGDQVLVVEPKDVVSVDPICDILDRYSLAGSVAVQATSLPILTAIKARGYRAYYYWASEPSTGTISTVVAAGADYLGGNGETFTNGKITELVATGKPTWFWTINRRHRATELFALGAAAVMTDEPTYLARSTPVRTTDSWATGVRGYGLNVYPTVTGFSITGGELRLSAASTQLACIGEVSPDTRTTRTIDFDCCFDSTATGGALLVMTAPDDKTYSTITGVGSQNPDGWMGYLRWTGVMSLFKLTSPTTTTLVGTNATTAALTAGGWAHMRLTITDTTVTVTRTDSAGTCTVTDSAFRGGYLYLGKKDTGAVARFKNLVIT